MTVVLVDDLLFTSKIQAAAAAAGVPCTFVRSRDAALAKIDQGGVERLVLDLDRDALDPIGVIGAIRSRPDLTSVRILAFVRHTSTDRIKAARDAGADTVLARSAFFPALGRLLTGADAEPQAGPGAL